MRCCHADFALVEGGDRGFTVGMPTFTFGSGVLAEAGDNALELGMRRVALYTDARLAGGEHVAKVRASLSAAGVDVAVYDAVKIEPDDASFRDAARFAADGRFDGYVSVGGGSVMDTCKVANLYAEHPAEFMAYVNAPIGEGRRVPGAVRPHIACPTTAGTGSETTGIAIFTFLALKPLNKRFKPGNQLRGGRSKTGHGNGHGGRPIGARSQPDPGIGEWAQQINLHARRISHEQRQEIRCFVVFFFSFGDEREFARVIGEHCADGTEFAKRFAEGPQGVAHGGRPLLEDHPAIAAAAPINAIDNRAAKQRAHDRMRLQQPLPTSHAGHKTERPLAGSLARGSAGGGSGVVGGLVRTGGESGVGHEVAPELKIKNDKWVLAAITSLAA